MYDNKLTLNYNYQNGTETVSLEDINQPFFSDCRNDSVPLQNNPNIFVTREVFGFIVPMKNIEELYERYGVRSGK